jgi:hypothetical protein
MDAADELLRRFSKYSRHCEAGLITPLEFVNAVLDQCAADDSGTLRLAPEVLTLVPEVARGLFIERVCEALRPEFRQPSWRYGGERKRTEEEDRQESEILTVRVRKWAAEFARLLSGEERWAEQNAAADGGA